MHGQENIPSLHRLREMPLTVDVLMVKIHSHGLHLNTNTFKLKAERDSDDNNEELLHNGHQHIGCDTAVEERKRAVVHEDTECGI